MSVASCTEYGPLRLIAPLDEDWTFTYRPQTEPDPLFAAVGFDDGTWPLVSLPHTWQTYETTRELHPFIRDPDEGDNPAWWTGWGWYRKRFLLDRSLAGRRVRLEFDGVMKRCRIWLNGRELGRHAGGYDSFSVDATDAATWGGENLLAVAVNNLRCDPGCTPPMRAGNFNVYGGIYRRIRLVLTDPVNVPFQGNADREGGLRVRFDEVNGESARWHIRTWIANESGRDRAITVLTRISDGTGRVEASIESNVDVAAGTLAPVDHRGTLTKPELWFPDHPRLYTAVTELSHSRQLKDRIVTSFGIRTVAWKRPDGQLLINGHPVRIAGTNLHQDYPWLGDAAPWRLRQEDLQDIRHGMGHSFLRTAHYPQEPAVYDWCDRHGLLVCEEVPCIKSQPFDEGIVHAMVRAMVRRDRNHPSIVMWSVGNETDRPADPSWVLEEDDSRIVHARHVDGPVGARAEHTHRDLEIEQLLKCTVRGWTGTPDHPEDEDAQACGGEELQHRLAAESGRLGGERLCVWLYADHGADREYAGCPLLHVNPKGWVDAWRQPKLAYHVWRAHYAPEPTVFVHAQGWVHGNLGRKLDIRVDSNCPEVELFAGGRSCGSRRIPDRPARTVVFEDVAVVEGELLAVGRGGDGEANHRIAMAGPASRLVLTATPAVMPALRSSVTTILADAVDERGTPVPGQSPELTWSTEGPTSLVGPSHYRSDRDRCGEREGTMYISLPVANFLRSTGRPGRSRIAVCSPGLLDGVTWVEAWSEPAHDPPGIVQPAVDSFGRMPVPLPDLAGRGTTSAIIAEATGDLVLAPDYQGRYAAPIRAFLRLLNPGLDADSEAFHDLVDAMSRSLADHGGRMIRDDYDFLVGRCNERLRASASGRPRSRSG